MIGYVAGGDLGDQKFGHYIRMMSHFGWICIFYEQTIFIIKVQKIKRHKTSF